MQFSSDLNLQTINIHPKNLTEMQLNSWQKSMQDAWSTEESLGELARCSDCHTQYSKEALLGNICKEDGIDITEYSVSAILHHFKLQENNFRCPKQDCHGKLQFPFGEKYLNHLKDYYAHQTNAMLTLVLDPSQGNNIVGFEGGYTGSLEAIMPEFIDHYKDFSLGEFKHALRSTLGVIPEQFFVCAYIGIDQRYRKNKKQGMKILTDLLRGFSSTVPPGYVGITETDQRNVLHGLMKKSGAVSLGLNTTQSGLERIRSYTQPYYQSDLLVSKDPHAIYTKMIASIERVLGR